MPTLSDPKLQLDLTSAAETAELTGASNDFGGWIGVILGGVLTIAALLLLLNLIWAGIDWITAGGDSGKIEKARSKITQSIVGIIVLVSALAIFNLVQNFIGVEILDFGNSSPTGTSNTTQPTTRTGVGTGPVTGRSNTVTQPDNNNSANNSSTGSTGTGAQNLIDTANNN